MTINEAFEQAYRLTTAERERIFRRQIVPMYRQLLKDIEIQLQALYAKLADVEPADYWNEAAKYGRLRQMEAQIIAEIGKAHPRIAKSLEESSRLSITNVYYRHQYIMDWVARDALTTFFVLAPEVVDVSVYGTPKIWQAIKQAKIDSVSAKFGPLSKYQPQHGTLLEVLVNNKARLQREIRGVITRGLVQGTSYTRVSQQLRKAMENSAYQALRISRTEGHRNMMAGNMAMTNRARAEGVDVRRKILSTLDSRTRPQSVTVDDRVENDDGYFLYPGGALVAIPGNSGNPAWDINDRETVINVVDGVSPELRRARDPVTGKTDIISYKSMAEWMEENGLKFNASGRMV